MKFPLQITFQNMKSSVMLEGWIREEATKLDRFYGEITACHVAIEGPHPRCKNGKPRHVRIDLTLPGKDLIIKREPVPSCWPQTIGEGDNLFKLHPLPPHHDLHLVIHDAFKTAVRRMQEFSRCRRGNVKAREQSPVVHVRRILPKQRCGALNAAD
jgi:hypothetical protein